MTRGPINPETAMRARDWLLLVILSVLWGGTFFFVGVAVKEIPPLTLVLARLAIAGAVLAPLVYLIGHRLPTDLAAWRDFAIMAVVNNILPFSLIFYGQTQIESGLASVLNATTPLMGLLVLRFVAGEAMSANKLAGVLVGLAGVAVLIGPDLGAASANSVLGMLACLGGALSYGFSSLWGRRMSAFHPLVTSAAQLLCSTAIMLPIAAVVDRFWLLAPPSWPAITATLALALASTALAYVIFFRIMASAGPANVMLVTLLIPISAIGLGSAFLGEALSLRQIAGALVIASGLILIDGRWMAAKPSHAHPS